MINGGTLHGPGGQPIGSILLDGTICGPGGRLAGTLGSILPDGTIAGPYGRLAGTLGSIRPAGGHKPPATPLPLPESSDRHRKGFIEPILPRSSAPIASRSRSDPPPRGTPSVDHNRAENDVRPKVPNWLRNAAKNDAAAAILLRSMES